jgi:carbamoyl-phosphate synthase large subunit
MNILFTCAGRRHYLLGYFKAIKGVKVVACDTSVYAPALYNADEYFIVPEVSDRNYINILLNKAIDHKIDAVIPLNDIELPILAGGKSTFEKEGICVIISDSRIIDFCYDKYKSFNFSEGLSLRPVPTFISISEAINYQQAVSECKFVVKPRWGTASIGVEYPIDNQELEIRYNLLQKRISNSYPEMECRSNHEHCVIIQRKIEGEEYGIDVVNNLSGKYEATLIRRKISMRSGETDKALTLHDERLEKIGQEIGKKLKHLGVLDCDLIIEGEEVYLLDMNPRFGGGYPFTHFAGANIPRVIIEWLKGKPTPKNCLKYRAGLCLAKTDIIIPTIS